MGGTYGGEVFEASAWYYSVVDVVNAFYSDIVVPINLTDGVTMTLGALLSLQSDDINAETLAEVGSEIGRTLHGLMTSH